MYFRAYRGTAALRKEIKNKWETRRSLKPSAGGTPKKWDHHHCGLEKVNCRINWIIDTCWWYKNIVNIDLKSN